MTTFVRICPKCKSEINYKNKTSFYTARKKNSQCRKCASVESGFFDRYASSENSGDNNPFYGKSHTDESKFIMAQVDKSNYKTKAFKEKMKSVVNRGETHHMFGSSHKKHWVDKYGEEKAFKMEVERKKKISKKTSGELNPMFGKPAPSKSGCGWKGWYGKWFFRSLRELSYVVNVIELNEWHWISAEVKELGIPYTNPMGAQRTYFADFLVNGNMLVEVKPLRLHDTPLVKSKSLAAQKFCDKMCFSYHIVDPDRLTSEEILSLHEDGKIRFTDEYEKKYRERYHS